MKQLVLKGTPYDGSYELVTSDEFTTREWGWAKRLSGYLPPDFDEQFRPLGDPEFLCVLTVVALHRAGKIDKADVPDVFERLLDNPIFDQLTIETDQDEGEDDHDLPPTSETNSNGNADTSGPGSTPSLANWELHRRPTGDPLSATSDSGQQTSGT